MLNPTPQGQTQGVTEPGATIASTEAASTVATDIANQIPTFSDILPEQVQPYWALVQQYPIIEAVIIFTLFWASASLIRVYALNLIQKLASKTNSQLDDQIIAELREPIFNTVLWFGLSDQIDWLHRRASSVYKPCSAVDDSPRLDQSHAFG